MPGVLICSAAFLPLARAQARGMGLPDMRVAVLPHPLRNFSFDDLVKRGIPQSGLEQVRKLIDVPVAR